MGNYNGFRGNKWLENRIEIFKEYVLPSLIRQGSENFYIWFQWRPEEKENPIVKKFQRFLDVVIGIYAVHTFGGITFYDDKYEDKEARERLMKSLEVSLPQLKAHVGDFPYVLLTIQPSDDMYLNFAAKKLQSEFAKKIEEGVERVAIGWKKGYIINYWTKEVAEYNTYEGWRVDGTSAYLTGTIPPFFTILFPSDVFLDPQKHFNHIGPYKTHEDIKNVMDYEEMPGKGYIVGCHGENISTTFTRRYKGRMLFPGERDELFVSVGILNAPLIDFVPSFRYRVRKFVNRLPFNWIIKTIYHRIPNKYKII